jgi:site-specific DNA recombinase
MSIRYYIYARKSSESSERQVQSIPDQLNRLNDLAKRLDLDVVGTYSESKSAKAPNQRPEFTKMISSIRAGEASGILCWQINRLSRNPQESGLIQQLLQDKAIRSIQTIDKEYKPEDNALLLSVETGVSNQFILDLRKNTIRGLQSKLEKGIPPYLAPEGYLNDKLNKTIIPDPDRFPLVKRMWEMLLSENYTAPKILEIVNKEWGYKTKKYRHRGGGELAQSSLYRIFKDPFYTGKFRYNGELYQGTYQPMITESQFKKARLILKSPNKPHPIKHEFAYTGLMRCSECGCLYTAENKYKKLKSGETRKYVYYHCTNKKSDYDCSQRKHIRERDLEAMIERMLTEITILPEFREWALEILNRENDNEIEKRTQLYEHQHKALATAQRELDNLTKMRYRELINDNEFSRNKKELKSQIDTIKQSMRDTEKRAEEWQEATEKVFDYVTFAKLRFLKGDKQTKREIISSLGSNHRIVDGNLVIDTYNWFIPIKEDYKQIESRYLELEPAKRCNDNKKGALDEILLDWGGRWGSNPRHPPPQGGVLPLNYGHHKPIQKH